MRSSRKRIFGARLVPYVVAALVLIAIVWVAAYQAISFEREQTFTRSARQAERIAKVFEGQTLNTFRYGDSYLKTARREFIENGGVDAVRRFMEDVPLDHVIVSHITVIDATGTPLLVSGHEIKPGTSAKDRGYFNFQKENEADRVFVSLPKEGRNSGKLLVRLVRRITMPDGRFGGVIFAALEVEQITQFFTALNLGPKSSATLVGTDKKIRARSSYGRLGPGQDISGSRIWRELERSPVGLYRQTSVVDDVTRYYAYRLLEDFPLIVAIGVAAEDISQAVTRFEIPVYAIAVLTTLVIVFMTILIFREIRVSQRLAAGEARVRAIVDSVLDGIVTVDGAGRIESFSAGAQRMFGYGRDEVLGQNVGILAAEPDRSNHDGYIGSYLGGGQAKIIGEGYREVTGRRKNGTVFPAELSVNETGEGDDHRFIGTLRDITERKQAEEALRRQTMAAHLLRKIAVTANEASDVEEAIRIGLDEVCAYTGWPVGHAYRLAGDGTGELVSTGLWHLDRPERFAAFREITERTRLAPGIGLPGRVLESSEPAWIDDITQDPNFPRATTSDDIGVRSGFAFPVLTGDEIEAVLEFYSEETAAPDEHLLEIMATVGTQLGRALERQKAEERIRRGQKMEAVGQLTGGVAHDFNNLLAVIQGNTEFLIDDLGDDNEPAQAIMRASGRGAELTQRLLAFSRRQPLHPRSIDLAALIESMSELLKRTLGETIEVETFAPSDLWKATADPGQVENALLNLAINARDAMPGGGGLTIECGNARFDLDRGEQDPEALVGDYSMLSVSDSGTGMTAEVLEHAFEPFFTTKEVGQGSGLGLSMVYGFAKQSGGHVTIQSEEGRGTTVRLYLPRSKDEARRGEAEGRGYIPRGRGEVVLVVEDDPDVRALAERMLDGLGYSVLAAGDARQGLEALEAAPRVDLLLSDVVLPGGASGPDLLERAKLSKPDLKVLFMSGYAEGSVRRRTGLPKGADLLDKPFRKHDLAQRIRAALDR